MHPRSIGIAVTIVFVLSILFSFQGTGPVSSFSDNRFCGDVAGEIFTDQHAFQGPIAQLVRAHA